MSVDSQKEILEAMRSRGPTIGSVYFVRCGEWIKIGWTRHDAGDRARQLAGGCPYPLELLGSIPGPLALERHLHRRFADRRGIGEWFRLSSQEVEGLLESKRAAKEAATR